MAGTEALTKDTGTLSKVQSCAGAPAEADNYRTKTPIAKQWGNLPRSDSPYIGYDLGTAPAQ